MKSGEKWGKSDFDSFMVIIIFGTGLSHVGDVLSLLAQVVFVLYDILLRGIIYKGKLLFICLSV